MPKPSLQQTLVNKYLTLQQKKDRLDAQFTKLENRITAFSTKFKLKTLRTPTHLLYVIQKIRTVFPKKGSPLRQQLENIIDSFPQKDKYVSLDVIKLGYAYDHQKLPSSLTSRLKPLANKKPYVKITLLPNQIQ